MKDILIGNIAEDAADQHEGGGDRTFIHRQPRGVCDNDLDLAQAGLVRPLASDCPLARVELNEASVDTRGRRIAGQHVDHIEPLARAEADNRQWAVSFGGEGLAELGPNHRQASTTRGVLLAAYRPCHSCPSIIPPAIPSVLPLQSRSRPPPALPAWV